MLAIRTLVCPGCGVEPVTVTATQLALLIHGGYGADRRNTLKVCDCAIRVSVSESVNPKTVPTAE